MADLTGTYQVKIEVVDKPTADLGTVVDTFKQTYENSLSYGTGSGKINLNHRSLRSLADGASENINLTSGLQNRAGATQAFVKVKFLAIKNNSTSQVLTVGGAASNTWTGPFADPTDKITVNPGETLVLVNDPAGRTVTPSTGDILKVANSAGAACTYDFIIQGSTA